MQIGKASRYDLARVPATTSKDASTEAAFRPLDPATSSSAESGCAMSASESEVGCGADPPLVLDYEQLERLRSVIETPVLITGRLGDRVPTLRVRPLDLVRAVRDRLHRDGVQLRDIRLNGGAASYVLGGGVRCGTMSDVGCIDADDTDDCCGDFRSRKRQPAYNDLDLIFRVHLSGPDDQEKVREAVLAVLPQFMNTSVDDGWLQTGSYSSSSSSSSACSTRSSTPTFSPLPSSSLSMIGHSYVHKMFRIYSERGDRWSLISLSNVRGRSIELKFADMMRRQFQFSVDSFQIILDGLLAFYDAVAAAAASGSTDGGGTENSVSAADAAAIILTTTPNFYPTVQAESAYDRISVALDHLRRKLIVTRRPEEIRGGGLLKYCSLLVRGYETLPGLDVLRQERYMCSRFFIDFPRLDDQRATLENYLAEHFVNAEDRRLRFAYLSTLGRVIESSTIRGPITMGFSSERAATLLVVRQMALTVLAEERMIMQQQQQQQQHMRHKAMIMMSMNATSGGLVETTPSPPGSPVKNGEDFLPSAFESHPFMNHHLQPIPNSDSAAGNHPHCLWVGDCGGSHLSSSSVTSLPLIDANGNELVVERIDYGPHPFLWQPYSTALQRNSNDSPVIDSCCIGAAAAADGTTHAEALCQHGGIGTRQQCSSAADKSASNPASDQFYVVYTYATAALQSGAADDSGTSSGGGSGLVVVRSCTPCYVSASRCNRCCCSFCCHRCHDNDACPRSGCETG